VNKTRIEFCDYTWNPVVGCRHGCEYCYARGIFQRFHRHRLGFEWTDPHLLPERLGEPHRVQRPSLVFVGSMTDLFGDWAPKEWIEAVLAVVREANRHTFAFLTKNPARYQEFHFPENVWLGATATNQTMADRALDALGVFEGKSVRYLSCEPLLEPIRLTRCPEWVGIGARTGRKPFHPPEEWVEILTADARRGGAAVFLKRSGGGGSFQPIRAALLDDGYRGRR
jgi:protein gp37